MKESVKQVARYLLKGSVPYYKQAPLIFDDSYYLTCQRSGCWMCFVRPNQTVQAGQVIDEICDIYGNILEKVTARKTVWSSTRKRPWSSTKAKCCWPLPARRLKATRHLKGRRMIKFIIKTILQFVLILLCVSFISLFTGLSSTGEIRLRASSCSGHSLYQGTAGNQAGRDGTEWQLYGAISGLAGQDCPW